MPPAREVTIDLNVIRAREGDQEAFARLYDAHAPRVYALCLRLCGDETPRPELGRLMTLPLSRSAA